MPIEELMEELLHKHKQTDRPTFGLDSYERAEQPTIYSESHPRLEKYIPRAVEAIEEYARQVGTQPEPNFHGVRVKVRKLPQGIKGVYFPSMDTVVIDRDTLENADDKFLESVVTHEFFHAYQKRAGTLRKYDKPLIEGGATAATEDATGIHQRVYQPLKERVRKLEGRHGKKRAFEGNVPANERTYEPAAYRIEDLREAA
ncbi:MAG: hypothetical protein HY831_04130 [Candidatus Aenigmarchaeota archaeon]|nr:hypothetical protein [Candidatus Aenigmarchaeota archaeon]